MGLFDWFNSTKRPEAGVAPASAANVRQTLLGLNRETAPWQIRDGAEEGVDLIAEWKIVDARWYELFAKASLTEVFQIHLKFDEAAREVRALDKRYSVSWRAGLPHLEFSASTFRGQTKSFSWGTAYAFKEDGQFGEVYNYRFATGEIKKPIQEAVTVAGWTYKGVSFGKL
ncbi:MAG: hypothetical protein AVDCRST_MAG73-2391 [uncultured Thermomicrobiales bacterium]|uniref:Uncharacterized protein n=1 Tax=uncultured Thermomicrobiales bacterium TaxID=1645740 RepID=A0A6J4UF12_9BACT|nr:MAG: hypothetical protein AVDCRST_MAG73-2391 [uncultured Thermomicrobiales bacterium]